MEIDELATVLYDDNGPSKIGIELNVLDNDGKVESNVYDVFEFLLHLLVIGIKQKNLDVNANNIGYIELKLQHYFQRINIHVTIEDVQHVDGTPYCNLYYDAITKTLSIKSNNVFKQQNVGLEDLCAIYTINQHCHVSISFGFAF
jgi:hypothetical protein